MKNAGKLDRLFIFGVSLRQQISHHETARSLPLTRRSNGTGGTLTAVACREAVQPLI